MMRTREARSCSWPRRIEGVRGVDGGALANAQLVEGITVLLVSINRNYKTQAGIRIAGICVSVRSSA